MKASTRDLAKAILDGGQITHLERYQGAVTKVTVKNFGHTYLIKNPYAKYPEITQLS